MIEDEEALGQWASPLKTARLALHEQRWLDAVHHYARLRRDAPDDWRGYGEACVAYRQLGQWEEADAVIEAGLAKLGEVKELLIAYGDTAMDQQRWDEALTRWERLRATHPEESRGWVRAIQAYVKADLIADALALIESCLQIFPESEAILNAVVPLGTEIDEGIKFLIGQAEATFALTGPNIEFEEYDVCIVGAGLTGLMAAKAALAQGLKVIVVERGQEYIPDELDRETWWKESVMGKEMGRGGRFHYKNSFKNSSKYFDDLVQNESAPPPWAFQYNMWYGVGGSSQMWSGMAWRLTPEDFKTKSHFGYGADWPISYDDLVYYYDRAERFLEVSGPPHSVRSKYKYWPWENNYAYENFPLSYLDEIFQEIVGGVGELVAQPHAVRNLPAEKGGCVGAKTCVSYCPSKAIFKGGERILPDIVFDDKLNISTNTAAIRVEWSNEDSEITAVVCENRSENRFFRVKAKKFFLCGNAFENIRLIKYSEIQNKKRFGLSAKNVGKYFTSHGAVTYTTVLREEVFPVRGRPTHASVIEWINRPRDSGYAGITMEVWNSDFTMGYAPWEHFEQHLNKGHFGWKLFDLLKSYEKRFCVSLIFETEMVAEKRVKLSSNGVDKFGIPFGSVDVGISDFDKRTLKKVEDIANSIKGSRGVVDLFENGRGLNGNHPLGGLRMSVSAREGVVNDRCRSHDFKNLYILGGGAFCSTGALNPTLTIVALAIRCFEDPELGWSNVPF